MLNESNVDAASRTEAAMERLRMPKGLDAPKTCGKFPVSSSVARLNRMSYARRALARRSGAGPSANAVSADSRRRVSRSSWRRPDGVLADTVARLAKAHDDAGEDHAGKQQQDDPDRQQPDHA